MKAGDVAGMILACSQQGVPIGPVDQRDIIIEHRLTSGRFRFAVCGVELDRDGRVVLLSDGNQLKDDRSEAK